MLNGHLKGESKISTSQMGYFDMLQSAKGFQPRANRLQQTAISTKWFNVLHAYGFQPKISRNNLKLQLECMEVVF